ncbi:hypothetical protein I8748_32185 [Nostoc sp. CENA67]|uniref:Uncharacterized protein n=1 Tax=Amazonocrinis nigriterrae CENA67 TaxID=2794033 RepID=A0A8J7I1U0_9NOST|nr:hypothetical protein [Amazonocrinis nigriterrae CENA67]
MRKFDHNGRPYHPSEFHRELRGDDTIKRMQKLYQDIIEPIILAWDDDNIPDFTQCLNICNQINNELELIDEVGDDAAFDLKMLRQNIDQFLQEVNHVRGTNYQSLHQAPSQAQSGTRRKAAPRAKMDRGCDHSISF